jgi:uncharacterized protein
VEAAQRFLDAARSGDIAAIESILQEHPAVLNHRNELGQSAVLLAKYHRQEAATQLLVDRGAELTLHEACAVGDLTRIQELLSGRGRLIDSFSGDGFTPLALACYFGHEETATWLVNQGASVSLAADNKMGVAPIHAAAGGRHLGILRMLVENGADVNARQQQGFTALHAAAQNGDAEAIRVLLAHGADRNVRADSNQTPLDLALQRGLSEIVALLES